MMSLRIDKIRLQATLHKWLGRNASDRGLTVAIIVAMIVMFIAAFTLQAEAHDLHLSDIQEQLGPMVTNFIWIEGFGYIGATEGYNGAPRQWWLFYKSIESPSGHSGVHAKPLTAEQAKELMEAK